MGKGSDFARLDAPEHAALIDDMKEQLLIVFLNRLGRSIDIPIAEVDATGNETFLLSVDFEAKTFHFELRKKQ